MCPENFVIKDRTLTYTVHFQNTGTARAINISILDELDPNLEINSVRVVSQSHPMIIDVLPSNTIDFLFDDINLPNSSSNQLASHGWVVFEVDPLPNLIDGTEFFNSVDIYFDYSLPILTNTVYTTYVDVIECSVGLYEHDKLEARIYPNPTEGNVTIELNQFTENISLRVTSIEGREVFSDTNISGNKFQLDLKAESRGMYWVTIQNGISKVTYKVVLQ
ncbi:MAG: T9SS type A sorting domain-containing protein [Crocinitomicaceae bacterium]|nr:T9SS type A sorting domain-containing protein [Crocinitomicaceae bacterium]